VAESDLDLFISYAAADREWAEWIAWTLKTAGYRIRIQAWHFDFSKTTNLAEEKLGLAVAVIIRESQLITDVGKMPDPPNSP
jgi:TIR domain